MADTNPVLEKAKISLERVQQFDTTKLARTAQLGEELNFEEAVAPATRIINLFRQFPIEFLPELPNNQLAVITNNADSFFNQLTQILEFNAKQSDAYNIRANLLESLKSQYQTFFDQLQQHISYGASRQRDFIAMERDFRASMQRSEDGAAELMKKLTALQDEAKSVLDEARKVAAEQGVSQQASYFKDESGIHETQANAWRKWTIWTAIGLGVYALISAFAHKWAWLAPSDTYQAVQLGLSKVLIFTVLAYMLILCARNFLSHMHNAIVNKHRQNALLTFNALVAAAGNDERRDVILTYAAACIFSPQDTGYTKGGSHSQSELPMSIINTLPKLTSGSPHA